MRELTPSQQNFRLCRKALWDRLRSAADTGECYVLRAAQIVVNDGKSCRSIASCGWRESEGDRTRRPSRKALPASIGLDEICCIGAPDRNVSDIYQSTPLVGDDDLLGPAVRSHRNAPEGKSCC